MLSICWNFFVLKSDKTTVSCKLCDHRLSYCQRSTSNMIHHVKTRHGVVYDAEQEKSKPKLQPKTEQVGITEPSASIHPFMLAQPTLKESIEKNTKIQARRSKKTSN